MVIKFNKLVHIVYMILYSKLDITGVYGTCWKFVYLGAVGVKMMADPIILGYPSLGAGAQISQSRGLGSSRIMTTLEQFPKLKMFDDV